MICPYCKEEITDGAIKCKHCKTYLTGDLPQNAPPAATVGSQPLETQPADLINKAKEMSSSVFGKVSSLDQSTRKVLSSGLFKLAGALSKEPDKKVKNKVKNGKYLDGDETEQDTDDALEDSSTEDTEQSADNAAEGDIAGGVEHDNDGVVEDDEEEQDNDESDEEDDEEDDED